MPKDNRPPKHLRTLKRGDTREDGMIFWSYKPEIPSGELWLPLCKYAIAYNKAQLRDKNKDNRPPKHLRTLKRGDVREDGMVFFCYKSSCPNGELWLTKNKYQERSKDALKRMKVWQKNNPDKMRDAENRRNKDSKKRLINSQRTRVRQALKAMKKSNRTMDLVGCSAIQLKDYIESKFQDGMSWDNYGKYGWHVDHIRPCASFDLSDPSQQEECFHYTNLQPLWAKDNLSKGSHYNPQTED